MRYFRYDGEMPDWKNTKILLKNLTADEQKRLRRAKWLHRLGTAVFWIILTGVFACCIGLFRLIQPVETDLLSEILFLVGEILVGCVGLGIGVFVGAIAAVPLWEKHDKSEKQIRNQILNDACVHLREFYGFREPFAVTKCYESSDRKFSRHDVCLFVVDGELRITANLHYGFFHPEKDLGCYAVGKQEISLRDAFHKERPAVELTAGDVTFCLSSKVKPFVVNYLSK